jgi:hypothetical protein
MQLYQPCTTSGRVQSPLGPHRLSPCHPSSGLWSDKGAFEDECTLVTSIRAIRASDGTLYAPLIVASKAILFFAPRVLFAQIIPVTPQQNEGFGIGDAVDGASPR